MIILGIETSCDETACAIVKNGTKLLSSVVASSADLHEKTGGIVPEIAARKQVEFIVPVIEETLRKFDGKFTDIDALAVTVGPGLIGSLIVGVEAAKALSVAWNKPLIPVNHLVGHIYGNFIDVEPLNLPVFPSLVLIVSGGHTDLVLMKNHGELEYLGGTLDDAAGEAFDKTARLLGLSKYLGGPLISKKAAECRYNSISGKLPRAKIKDDDFDFSFSGLKSAVKRMIEAKQFSVEEISCEFENAVVDVLVEKTVKAANLYKVKSIMLAGGVAANTKLRTRLKNESQSLNITFHVPPINLCTDNAIYIASAAYFNKSSVPLANILANPSLGVMDSVA